MKSTHTPAFFGELGPGEITAAFGESAMSPRGMAASLRTTFTSAPRVSKQWTKLYVKES